MKHTNHEALLREALNKVRGYGSADMGHQQMCDYITEVAEEALEATKHGETETLDLMRDEFRRIRGLTDNDEIKGLCDRAVSGIEQHVPVIVQRDECQDRAEMLRRALSTLNQKVHSGYDFNSDPEFVTRLVGDALRESV